MSSTLINPNPIIYNTANGPKRDRIDKDDEGASGCDESAPEEIDALEVFDILRHINDPEHPLTLEQLNVAQLEHIKVDNKANTVKINFTPTIPHCSMATLIGLSLRVKLLRSLPSRFKVDIQITPGTHASQDAVNKQLNDKERVCAALENGQLLEVLNKCIANTDPAPDLSGIVDIESLVPR